MVVSSDAFEPKGLLNSDDNYMLQQADVVQLLKYVWGGVLLPSTESEYRSRLQISNDVFTKLSDVIKPLVQAYAVTKEHCKVFKDTTYPGIINIASDVYNYAQNAGGSSQDSYYAYIFQCIRKLDHVTSEEEKARLIKTINELVDMQVKNIDKICTKSQAVVADLRTFHDNTRKDQSILQERSTAVHNKLKAEVGSLDDLETKLQNYRIELNNDMAEYEYDKTVACTTPAYAWLGLIGMISAAAVAGVYGDKAVKMAARIDEVRKLISDYEQKFEDETRVVGDLRAIDKHVDNILSLVEPAIQTVEKMVGIWQAIANDLKNLKDMVDTDIRQATALVADIVEAKVLEKWNALKEKVDKYRQAAYVSDADSISLDDLSKQLHEQAGN
ncbi:uncharacterized protein SCHCODRAFT_02639284 [Schizophyllum commune H4-8]|uniref:uncharacterized protein n=1 Tax=Schizophyllum commune (strain H4-8 / FGSC 9210) TaxID=578458 RepID=UPI00215E96D0|nr:uncharacterized protein SCHCODRAFT_02639284 [Schizophyllum commune H4-8]KAI5887936.1 hypothetical protein SCHCODRAFT_02639284 [Schizophyllum commune H4-8]